MFKENILALDIGNTMTTVVVLKGKRRSGSFSVSSTLSLSRYQRDLSKGLNSIKNIDRVMICSVVPRLTKVVEKVAKKRFHVIVDVVGRDIHVPIKNDYDRPDEVGQDRLVCAYAAKELYGLPCLVIDLGTAITLDVVSSKGVYEGGMIIPGIRLSLLSLHAHTALLPKVDIKVPRKLIGKNTQESMLSGVFFGYGAMLSGLIDKMSGHLKQPPYIILTGGYADLMKRFLLKKNPLIEKDLIFKGLLWLSQRTR